MPKLSEIKQAVSVLEAAQAKGQIPDHLLEKIAALDDIRSYVKSALLSKLAEIEKRELTDQLVDTLKSHFEESNNEKLRNSIDFAEVEKSLRANPEALFSLQKLEETGGEPQVVGIEGDEFIFEDRSAESPEGRRYMTFDGADAQRKEFGPNVKFQSPDSYKAMLKTGNFDQYSNSYLETDDKTMEAGNFVLGDSNGVDVANKYDNFNFSKAKDFEHYGWRAALRVKKY